MGRELTVCSKKSFDMKIGKINPGGVLLIFLVLLQTLELSAEPSGNRVFNGHQSRKNAFPWLVNIQSSIINSNDFQLCGGTLLNPKVVLTAAHCTFYDNGQAIPAQMMKVNLGDHNARGDEFGEQEAGVTHFKNHPYYNADTLDNDFSLMFLNRFIMFSKTISSACLVKPHINTNTRVTAAGWGKDHFGHSFNVLQQVDLTTMSNQECDRMKQWKTTKGTPIRITNNMLCATGRLKGTCNGDSGGPLMLKGNEKMVIGVTSWGSIYCNGNDPSFFGRVSNQLRWIKANAEREGRICIK